MNHAFTRPALAACLAGFFCTLQAEETGLRPLTAEEIEWGRTNLVIPRKVRLNALGWAD